MLSTRRTLFTTEPCLSRNLKPGTAALFRIRQPTAQALAQYAMLDLTGGRARHLRLRQEGDRAWPLVSGHLVATPLQDFGGGGRGALMQHDDRVHGLTPFLVRQSDDPNVLD